MTSCFFALSLLATAQAKDAHLELNPIYRNLRQEGLNLAPGVTLKFPAPHFPDGLSAAQQQDRLKALLGDEYSYSEFTRRSQVAPQRLRLNELTPSAPQSLTRSIGVLFVAYGDKKAIASKKFLDNVLDINRKEGKAADLQPQDLAKRGLTLRDKEHEAYGYLIFNLIDKVQLEATGHSYWSETDESILAATRIDERFGNDPEFPNRWRPITKGRDGKNRVGEKALPYAGAGYYVKITRLAQPKGAVVVEGHVLFKEPQAWFNGTNLLRGKLPPVIQNQVRTFRRELARASGG